MTEGTLASELLTLADREEATIGAFMARAVGDAAFGGEVRRRLGWHPTDDPVELWHRTGHAPPSPWTIAWDRERHPEGGAVVDAVAAGTEGLAQALEAVDWPGRSLVGEDGADAAWFLAMHADGDEALQRRCVDRLDLAVAVGEADPRHLAGLVDRLASTHEGRQRFGTLVLPSGDRLEPLVPVVDPDGLDERRAALGLPALADDVAEGLGQLPYRHLRRTGAYRWPPSPPGD